MSRQAKGFGGLVCGLLLSTRDLDEVQEVVSERVDVTCWAWAWAWGLWGFWHLILVDFPSSAKRNAGQDSLEPAGRVLGAGSFCKGLCSTAGPGGLVGEASIEVACVANSSRGLTYSLLVQEMLLSESSSPQSFV